MGFSSRSARWSSMRGACSSLFRCLCFVGEGVEWVSWCMYTHTPPTQFEHTQIHKHKHKHKHTNTNARTFPRKSSWKGGGTKAASKGDGGNSPING